MVGSDTLGVLGLVFGIGGHLLYRKFKGPPTIKPILPYWIFNIVRFAFAGLFLVLALNYSIRFGQDSESYEYTMLIDQYSKVHGETSATRCYLEIDNDSYYKYRDAISVECEQIPTDKGMVTFTFSTGMFGMKVVESYQFSDQTGKPLKVYDAWIYGTF